MTPLALVRKRREEPTFQSSGNGQKGQTYLRKNTSLYQYMTSKDSCFWNHLLKAFGLRLYLEALNMWHLFMTSLFLFDNMWDYTGLQVALESSNYLLSWVWAWQRRQLWAMHPASWFNESWSQQSCGIPVAPQVSCRLIRFVQNLVICVVLWFSVLENLGDHISYLVLLLPMIFWS